MTRRWRPSLGFVLGGGLFGTLVISLAGLVVFRYIGPEIGYKRAAFLLGACIAGATAILGWLLIRLLMRPITALQGYVAEVQANPQSPPTPPDHFGTSELHSTAQSVIEMASVLRDRESAMRSYSDHVTHEIKTPVAAIRAATELLEDSPELSDEDLSLVAQIAGAGRQIEAQLDALRRVARARETRYVGETTLDEALLLLGDAALNIHADGPVHLAIPLSAEGLAVVLGHLIGNAREHGASEVSLRTAEDDEAITLLVCDTGPGISEGNRARIFEPFFTTRRDENGTGMGLAITRNILEAHRAEIRLLPPEDTPANKGACFEIRFPL